MNQWLNDITTFLNNGTWISWLIALGIAVGLTAVAKLGLCYLIPKIEKFASRTSNSWDDILIESLKKIKIWVIFVIISSPIMHLVNQGENTSIDNALKLLTVVAITYQVCLCFITALRLWRSKVLSTKLQAHKSSEAAINLLISAIQVIVVVILCLIALSNVGVDVTAVVTSLGIGGIAIALAVQSILSDLLSSVSIVLDKPFEVGDNITVGNDSGVVEHIGVKTTRLRAPTGEQLIFANKDLLDNRIHNFKRQNRRRVEKRITILRQGTSQEQILKLGTWVKEYLSKNDKITFDYCRLSSVESDYLDFELLFYITDTSSAYFVALQEQFLLDLMNQFNKEQICITAPSKNDSRVHVSGTRVRKIIED